MLKRWILRQVFERYIGWRLGEFTAPNIPILLDYPVAPRPRFGFGRPAHPELSRRIGQGHATYRNHLVRFNDFSDALSRIATRPLRQPDEPFWENTWFTGLDAVALYCLLAMRNPGHYVEVGSGNSTKFARRAIRDFGLRTRITSVDPRPRAEIDRIADRIVRQPLEDTDLAFVGALSAGDVLFIDNSHRSFMNSDVTVTFLEVLPRLRPGVLVHLHDIWLPLDYPPGWSRRYYSEQYLLAAYLLGGAQGMDILLPNAYVGVTEDLSSVLDPLWNQATLAGAKAHTAQLIRKFAGCDTGILGLSFWLVTR